MQTFIFADTPIAPAPISAISFGLSLPSLATASAATRAVSSIRDSVRTEYPSAAENVHLPSICMPDRGALSTKYARLARARADANALRRWKQFSSKLRMREWVGQSSYEQELRAPLAKVASLSERQVVRVRVREPYDTRPAVAVLPAATAPSRTPYPAASTISAAAFGFADADAAEVAAASRAVEHLRNVETLRASPERASRQLPKSLASSKSEAIRQEALELARDIHPLRTKAPNEPDSSDDPIRNFKKALAADRARHAHGSMKHGNRPRIQRCPV